MKYAQKGPVMHSIKKSLFLLMLIIMPAFTTPLYAQVAAPASSVTAGTSCTGSPANGSTNFYLFPSTGGAVLGCNGSVWTAIFKAPGTPVQTDVTASRAAGTAYQNTTGKMLTVEVYGSFSSRSGGCFSDSTTSPTTAVMGNTGGGDFVVLPNNYYSCGSGGTTITSWVEVTEPY